MNVLWKYETKIQIDIKSIHRNLPLFSDTLHRYFMNVRNNKNKTRIDLQAQNDMMEKGENEMSKVQKENGDCGQ